MITAHVLCKLIVFWRVGVIINFEKCTYMPIRFDVSNLNTLLPLIDIHHYNEIMVELYMIGF